VETTLLSALDPSHPRVVAAVPDGTTLPPDLKASVPDSHFLEIAAHAKEAAPFESAAAIFAAYRRKWFSASAADPHS
jgi:hypothetical protein